MVDFAEAMRDSMREELAVRREDFDKLRDEFSVLIRAQNRTEARVAELAEAQTRTEARVAELAEAQNRTEARLDRLEAIVIELAEAQKRTEQRIEDLTKAQQETNRQIERLWGKVGNMDGRLLELTYKEKMHALFGRLLRHMRVPPLQDIEDELEQVLTEDEYFDLIRLDLVVQGRSRHLPEKPDVLLAVEISSLVEENDVERVVRRAKLLQKAGYLVIPIVAGERIDTQAQQQAEALNVLIQLDGKMIYLDEALSAWG